MAPLCVVYTLQFVERVLEAAGGINGLAAAGINMHHHVVQLFVSDGMPVWRHRNISIITA